jgi:hypothetical protein
MLAAALQQGHPPRPRQPPPDPKIAGFPCNQIGVVGVDRTRDVEGLAMAEEGKSWWGKFGPFGRGDLATQAAVLLPVMAIVVMSAWTMGARGQSAETSPRTVDVLQSTSSDLPTPGNPDVGATAAAASAVNGLKIASQSWRRGGLGSNALFNFTLRNTNDYAVGDIQVACTFTRHDGSALTERKRVIPDAVVNTKSRKTFARVHIGFVNVNADKAKCVPVAARRL